MSESPFLTEQHDAVRDTVREFALAEVAPDRREGATPTPSSPGRP